MINKWKLFNFKSVERAELSLSPLTLFAGANSSGKSTFLQSILLISQTLASRVGSQIVVLNGHLAKLGQFNDLRTAGADSNEIRIAWDLTVPAERAVDAPYLRRAVALNTVSCDITFGVPPGGGSQTHYQLNPKLFASSCSGSETALSGEGLSAVHSLRLKAKGDSPSDDSEGSTERPRSMWTFDFDIELDQNSLDELRDELSSPKPVGCNLQHFLPQWLIVQFDEQTEIIKALTRPLIDPLRSRVATRHLNTDDVSIPGPIIEFLNQKRAELERPELVSSNVGDASLPLTDVLHWLRGARLRQRSKIPELAKALTNLAAEVLPKKVGLTTIEMPPAFRDALEYLSFFFSRSVRYLGPLREEPRPMYPLQDTADPQDIGLHGEHTAAVFHNYRHLEISYIPSAAFAIATTPPARRRESLERAVFDWLSYLDVATKVETRDAGKFGHALAVYLGGKVSHDLTHVGVGVSQILPIVVMCLLATSDTTLVLEQPELHLNPKVQTRLGDFFLSMSLLGKQCLIETHSEYLINRLRYRAASAPTDSFSKLMTLYFVEKQADVTVYRDVVINEFGAILDWPAGFFDQSQREVEDILLAATRKAKAETST
jgi:predicted ATPase